MKVTLVLFLIVFSSIQSHPMIDKLIKSNKYNSKKDTLIIIGNLLFDRGYEPAFVAGILGNIYNEAVIGKFESSNYSSRPDLKPDYLKYMDDNYDYKNKYSGRIITEVNLQDVGTLLEKLKRDSWKKGKFGLGCVQWTGSRTYDIWKLYNNECGSCTKINIQQATKAEGKFIINELEGTYSHIRSTWKKENSNLNSPLAAYNAGYLITKKYEKPKDLEGQAKIRGKTAQNMYSEMVK